MDDLFKIDINFPVIGASYLPFIKFLSFEGKKKQKSIFSIKVKYS